MAEKPILILKKSILIFVILTKNICFGNVCTKNFQYYFWQSDCNSIPKIVKSFTKGKNISREKAHDLYFKLLTIFSIPFRGAIKPKKEFLCYASTLISFFFLQPLHHFPHTQVKYHIYKSVLSLAYSSCLSYQ